MIVTSILVFLATFLFFRKLFGTSQYKFPPGPVGLPFLGNLHQLGSFPLFNFERGIEWTKQYGDIFTTSIIGYKVVVLSSIEAITDAKFTSSDDFNHRPLKDLKNLSRITDGIVFKAPGDNTNRRFTLTNLKRRGMGKSELEPIINNEADALKQYLECNPILDPAQVLGNFATNVVSQVVFARRWEYGDHEYDKLIDAVHRNLGYVAPLSNLDIFPLLGVFPKFKNMLAENEKARDEVSNIFRKIIREKRGDNIDGQFEGHDIVDDYMNMNKEWNSEHSENLVDICRDLFIAGTDTTSATLSFAILHMLRNPEFQKEFHEQVYKVLGGRDPRLTDLPNLPFPEAFIQETLRHNPLAPTIIHCTFNDVKLRDFYLPADQYIQVNAYVINHDERYFPDPYNFNPHRWINAEGKFRNDLVDKMMTFGQGRRSCIGRPLARMEMFICLVKLVQNFELSVPEGQILANNEVEGGSVTAVPPSYLVRFKCRAN